MSELVYKNEGRLGFYKKETNTNMDIVIQLKKMISL